MWYWFDNITQKWILASESESIEEEYHLFLTNEKYGKRGYYCFGRSNRVASIEASSTCLSQRPNGSNRDPLDLGNGPIVRIDFNTMTTYCGDGACISTHGLHLLHGLDHNHATYTLVRF